MSDIFNLTEEQRRTVLTQVSNKTGLPGQAVEKDLWVTTLLQIVFTLPFADKLVFKGGTSLSKVYHLIERFSEDIDLAIDRSMFGQEGDLTKRQTKKLRKDSSLFVKNTFAQTLRDAIAEQGLGCFCVVVPEPDGERDNTYPEPRRIHILYKSVFGSAAYLQPEVQLEIGARSLFEPAEQAHVESLVTSAFGNINTSLVRPAITTALPEKTFLEKAFLLHELFTTDRAVRADRKSRHLYDLEKMMDRPFAVNAIRDDELWNTIAHHRGVFTSVSGVDYAPDIRKRICLVPPAEYLDTWEDDYRSMQQSMIYGVSLSFGKLLERMRALEDRFRR